MIFDTHAHYDSEQFDDDREELLRGMPAKGIPVLVNVGAELQGCRDSIALAEKYPNVYAAVGIHPDSTGDLTEEDIQWMKSRMSLPKVVAVGEIGLDYYWDNAPREIQKKWFVRQIELAKEVGLPIIIHSREAAQDTMEIVRETKAWECGGVIHCYSYSPEQAREYLDMGFFLGIGGVVTFKNSRKLKEVVEMAPIERLVLETDSPYLAPVPNRGKRNDSSQLAYVAEEIAGLKGISREEVERITFENAFRLYPKVKKAGNDSD